MNELLDAVLSTRQTCYGSSLGNRVTVIITSTVASSYDWTMTYIYNYLRKMSSKLSGFASILSDKAEPETPEWLHKKTDTVHSSQTTLPTIDLSEQDIRSRSAAVTAQSKRILDLSKDKISTKSRTKKRPVKRAAIRRIKKRTSLKKKKKVVKRQRRR